jgi:hypothetical protein
MTNVVQFRGRLADAIPSVGVDGCALATAIVWASLRDLRTAILASNNPALVCEVVHLIATGLVAKHYTDAFARRGGWHSVEAMRERGRDMLLLLHEFESCGHSCVVPEQRRHLALCWAITAPNRTYSDGSTNDFFPAA